jgi:peptide-methionine (S)-S-oxide reductase
MEKPFDVLPGVVSTTSGYTGGQTERPSYRQVSSGTTGHAESVQVVYDPMQVSYEKLLDVFWHNVDPLDGGGQFCDRGSQYRSSVFFYDEAQRKQAEQSKQTLEQSGIQPIATEIVAASEFYPAEDYHQNYYETNALKYRFYRFTCGRDQRLAQVWGETAAIDYHVANDTKKAERIDIVSANAIMPNIWYKGVTQCTFKKLCKVAQEIIADLSTSNSVSL